jgi:O-antigen/teichoic acid export membrane protein
MLVSIRILTSLLSPEEVGNYYLAMTILAFFNLILLNPPGTYFSRHLLEWQRTKNLLNAIFVFILWISIVALFSIIFIYILFEFTNYSEKFNYILFILFIMSSIVVSTIHRNLIYGSNTIGFRKEFVVFLIITLIIGLFLSSALVYYYQPSSLNWLFGIIISEFLVLYFAFKFFVNGNLLDIKKINDTITKDRLKKILLFAFPIAITTFLMWGQSMSYRFIVDYKYSAEVLGYIAIGLGISSAVFSSLEAIAMQYFSPVFLKDILDASKEERSKAWNKMASFLIPIYVLALAFTIAMSKELIFVMVDSKFHDTYTYAMVGATLEFFRVISNLLNNVSQSEHKTIYTILPYTLGFLVAIFCLLFFDFGENVVMIPVVLSLAYLLVCIVMYIQMKKLLDIKLEVNFLKILILSIPFGLIFLLPSSNSILISLGYLGLFGSYLLLSFWITLKKNYA